MWRWTRVPGRYCNVGWTVEQRLGSMDTRRCSARSKESQLKTSYVRALLPRLARKAGIERRVHAHALRHSFAAELAAERTPMNIVQSVLGHANLATTDAYLRHINPVVAIETLRARSWCF